LRRFPRLFRWVSGTALIVSVLTVATKPGFADSTPQTASPSQPDSLSSLQETPLSKVDPSGRMVISDPPPPPPPLGPKTPFDVASASELNPQSAPFPYAQTFQLHSRVGASKVIYLDFDGFTTAAGTSAWGNYNGTPYDTDSDPLTFSSAEQDVIQSVFQRMSEDFAPFDVDVTTEDPGQSAIERTGSTDTNFGTRVAFVGSAGTMAYCNGTCGGVAYVDVFDEPDTHTYYQPAWVVASGAPGAKNMAEAGSHEAGHNLGLLHDGCAYTLGTCTVLQGYYTGHANWAPIMGVGYYRPVSQWSSGEYLGSSDSVDDLHVIASKTGLIPDESNNSIPAATDLGVLDVPRNGSGLISSGTDADYFRFTSPTAGQIKVTAKPVLNSPNLDATIQLLDAAGAVLATAAPTSGTASAPDVASGLGAEIILDLASAGDFFLRVGSDQTDPTGDVGYSTYGSVGRYTVSAETLVASGASFRPVAVSRLLDTRPTPISAGAVQNLTVAGVAGVPTNATAVSLNVAAVNPLGAGHLRVFPAGTPLPNASVLNFAAGKNTPNHVIVKVGAGGQISIYGGNTTNVIVDINGYYVSTQTDNDQYVPVGTPTRIHTAVLPGAVVGNPEASTVDVPVLGQGGIPLTAGGHGITTVAVNVGAIDPTAAGHLRVFPKTTPGAPFPNASTHNFVAGDSRMNLVIVESGVGSIRIYNASAGPVTITVDTVGWFQPVGLGFNALDPIRPLDTRGTPPIAAGDFREVQIRGFGGVPDSVDVKAVAVNVAAVTPSAVGSIDVGPSGANPLLPSFTHPANENAANLVIVPVGADGKIRIRNNSVGTSHVIVDITGYYSN
jgi:hypothetical protein